MNNVDTLNMSNLEKVIETTYNEEKISNSSIKDIYEKISSDLLQFRCVLFIFFLHLILINTTLQFEFLTILNVPVALESL